MMPTTDGGADGVQRLVMQLAGQQLLAKLLDDVMASMTVEQKAACAEALTKTFLQRIMKGDSDWDLRKYVDAALQKLVSDTLEPLRPQIEASARKALDEGVVAKSESTAKLIDDAIQRKVYHYVEELRRDLSGMGRRV